MKLRPGDKVRVVEHNKVRYGVVGMILDDGLVVVDFDDSEARSLSYPPERVRRR